MYEEYKKDPLGFEVKVSEASAKFRKEYLKNRVIYNESKKIAQTG